MSYSYPLLRAYCDCCARPRDIRIADLHKDDRGTIAGDVVCQACHSILLTLHGDREGEVSLRMEDDVANEIAAAQE